MLTARFSYLRCKYDALYTEQEQLKLGERYMLHSFENPDHIKCIFQEYVDKGLHLAQIDQEIIELISYHHKGYYTALRQVFNTLYHETPNLLKYSISDIVEQNTFYHGPPLDISMTDTSLTLEPGVAFKNHKYFNYFQDLAFDYDIYEERLKELVYNDDGSPPIGISNNEMKGNIYLSDYPTRFEENPHFNSIKIYKLWDYFKDAGSIMTNITLKECTEVVNMIESGVSCSFSYGQFSQVFQCMKHMKLKAGRNSFFTPLYPSKLKNYVYYGEVTCASNFSEKQTKNFRSNSGTIESRPRKRMRESLVDICCDVNYTIVIDLMHRLVVVKQHGKHSKDCETHQKRKGYLFYRRQIQRYGEKQAKTLFDYNLLKHYGRDEIITTNKEKWFVKKSSIFTCKNRTQNYN